MFVAVQCFHLAQKLLPRTIIMVLVRLDILYELQVKLRNRLEA